MIEGSRATGLGSRTRVSRAGPTLVGLVVGAVALGYVVLGMALHQWDPSEFVRASAPYADAARVPPTLHVYPRRRGYDGMFFYRLAVDPALVRRDAGVGIDVPPYREQRILYPLIVWVASLDDPARVPALLVATNVLGLALLGLFGAHYAQALGRSAWWGVALPLHAGFQFSLTRDLAEIVEACFLVGAFLAIQQRRFPLAAIGLALAVLTRETAVMAAICVLVAGRLPHRRRLPVPWYVGAVGVAAYGLDSGVMAARWGVLPLVAGSGGLGVPFQGLVTYVRATGRLGWIELAYFVALCAGALSVRGAPPPLFWTFVAYLVLALALSGAVWAGDAAWLRGATELWVFGWLVLYHERGRLPLLLLASGSALWLALARLVIVD
ncbi:MAG: hypothetical protein JO023_05845 [Chloroflexi bacterium]|nr:hypothetical protein [Chloroflexota bacterium]